MNAMTGDIMWAEMEDYVTRVTNELAYSVVIWRTMIDLVICCGGWRKFKYKFFHVATTYVSNTDNTNTCPHDK